MQKRTSRKTLAEQYGVSVRTIDRRLKEMQQLTGIRYPERTIIKTPSVRIWDEAAQDFFEHYTEIRLGIAPAFEGRKT